MNSTKPSENKLRLMLAVDAPAKLRYPLFASPKLDGIRCAIVGGEAMSRTMKPIPNAFVQNYLGTPNLEGLDGELIVGPPSAEDVYSQTSSGVMSRDGEPDFTYYVFDYHNDPSGKTPYCERMKRLQAGIGGLEGYMRIKYLHQTLIEDEQKLLEYEKHVLAQGFEGVMLRSVDGLYKNGRSTAREGYLLKLKRFTDGEAEITGFEELMHNANAAELDERGYTKRSSHADGKVPMGVLGALVVKDLKTGIAFKIGTGYTAHHRAALWDQRHTLIGRVVKYKHFEIGVKDAPRFPVWQGFREAIDM